MHIKKIQIFLIAFSLFFTTQAIAQNVEKMQTIEVKSTRLNFTKDTTPASVTIINEEKIKKSGQFLIEKLIRTVPGLTVTQSGGLGRLTSINIRGAGTGSTLVMIDGIQINQSLVGLFDFHDLNVDNIERIEVLRGTQSTLWGADAVGGVIQIFTKKGKGTPSHYASFEGGSFSTFKETIGSSGTFKDYNYSISASQTDSNGITAAAQNLGNSEKDDYGASNISFRLGHDLFSNFKTELIGRYTKSSTEFDDFSSTTFLPTDGENFSKTESIYFAVPIKKSITDWWNTKLNLNFSSDKSQSFSTSTSTIHNRTWTADFQNQFDLGAGFSSVAGFEHQVLNGTNQESNLHVSNFQQGAYLQTKYNFQDQLILTAGIRYNKNQAFNDRTTYQFEGLYKLSNTGTSIRASVATGFRAPTGNDLFFPNFSNPDLKPEKSENWEVGFDQTLLNNRLTFGAVYFDSEIKNKIQFDFTTFAPENIGLANSEGIESYINYNVVEDLTFSANYTWNQAVDGDKARLIRVPKHVFNASIDYLNGPLTSLFGIYARSNVRDSSSVINGFATIRMALKYQVTENLTITARGENLLDKDYEEISGFETAGIAGYGGLSYNF
jgi:vitamin B12 transporter